MDGIHLRPGRPLLAAAARPWAGALLACCALLVAVLGVLFAHQARADWLDQAVDAPIITWPGGQGGLVLWLAFPGSLIPTGAVSAAIVVGCLLTGRLNGAVLAAVAVPAAVGLDDGLLKPLVHRTCLGVLTYPSGHTTAMFTLAAAAWGRGAARIDPGGSVRAGSRRRYRRHRPAMALLHRYRGRRRCRHRNGLRAGARAGSASRQAVA